MRTRRKAVRKFRTLRSERLMFINVTTAERASYGRGNTWPTRRLTVTSVAAIERSILEDTS